MSNYTKATDFAAKDSLPSGNAAKVVKGTEIDDEFAAIQTAITTKLDISGFDAAFDTAFAAASSGKVLQVVYGNAASDVTTTNSTTYVDSATASITPSATSSKIFIIANPYLALSRSGANQAQVGFYIAKNGTVLSDYPGQSFKIQDTDTNAGIIVQPVMHYLDSPETTSAITYTVKVANSNATGVFTSYEEGSITLMEIGS
jgi:hypothetical protein